MLRRAFVWLVPLGTVVFALLLLLLLHILLPHNAANAVNVASQHGQSHIALEAINAMVWAHIQAMHLQAIDGGLHRRVGPAGFDESGGLLFFLNP